MKDWRKFTLSMIQRYKFKSNKQFGQNFLVNSKIVQDMVSHGNLHRSDRVLEIGGGFGILSSFLDMRTDYLTIIEKDVILAEYLISTYQNATVIEADALEVTWPQVDKLLSNIPYSITSKLLERILHANVKKAVLMMQKEVAQRCLAKPGSRDYGSLSILVNMHANPIHVQNVNANSFIPVPKVESAILVLDMKYRETTNSHNEIELLTKNLFSLKRRVLRSVLRGFLKRRSKKPLWESAPYKNLRVNHLSHKEIDEILTFLKEENSWPLS